MQQSQMRRDEVKKIQVSTVLWLLCCGWPASVVAAQTESMQHDHGAMGQPASGTDHGSSYRDTSTPTGQKLKMLKHQPASGAAREAGSDGRYVMESTGMDADLQQRCAQASRGMVMLDNAAWQRCGGKTPGVADGPGANAAVPPQDHQRH